MLFCTVCCSHVDWMQMSNAGQRVMVWLLARASLPLLGCWEWIFLVPLLSFFPLPFCTDAIPLFDLKETLLIKSLLVCARCTGCASSPMFGVSVTDETSSLSKYQLVLAGFWVHAPHLPALWFWVSFSHVDNIQPHTYTSWEFIELEMTGGKDEVGLCRVT